MTLVTLRHQGLSASVILATTTIIPMMVLSCLMKFWTLPKLLHRRPWRFFFVNTLIVAILVVTATPVDLFVYDTVIPSLGIEINYHPIIRNQIDAGLSNTFFLHTKYTFLLLCSAIVTAISFQLKEQEQLKQDIHEQQIQNELKFLRQQINPHFLFNALNCIYALAQIRDPKAPDSIMKLSQMMRYVLTDCSMEMVPLKKEIEYIRNYIDFYRIRLENEPNVQLDISVKDPAYSIPPMLLQPIVENSFKHSRIVDDPDAWISIVIHQDDTGLTFICDNSKPSVANKSTEHVGIGLQNVQQRLKMIYGEEESSLKIIEDERHYKTELHV